METKRDAVGVVDAINAEDIGKFPDTNLSEALQRITGVSIDRRNGEGSTVTARGFGPQFNMVTLNGRQMPAADAFADGGATGGGASGNSRSFNFANLAAEAINAVEVYKTSRADIATGGIGATINIKTARPLDNDGLVLNVGAKVVNDTTNRVGEDFTPELSGIFSWASDSKMFGVGVSASYQRRDSGSSSSTVNDWHIQPWVGSSVAANQGAAPLYINNNDTPYLGTDDFVNAQIVNAPANGQLYGIPNDIRYAFSDSSRERINGQVTLQFAPMESLTFTVDYTFAQQQLTEDRGEQTIWLQRNGFNYLEFDTGNAVATPVVLREWTGASKDFGYEQQHREQENQLKSPGLNVNWDVTDNFNLGFDFHDSKATSLPNDPITGGSQTAFSLAGKVPSTCLESYAPNPANPTAAPPCRNASNFWTQEFRFNDGLPIAARTLYPSQLNAYAGVNGNSDYSFNTSSLGSQVLRIAYQDQTTDIMQARLDGKLKFENGSIAFGIETRSMDSQQRTSGGTIHMGDWGVADAGSVPTLVDLLTPFSVSGSFDDFNPVGAPTGGWKGNADTLGLWSIARGNTDPTNAAGLWHYANWDEAAAPDGELRYNPGFGTNSKVEEDTKSIYLQFAMKAELGDMPANVVLGARYETTDVTSTAIILVPTAVRWEDDNDFSVVRPTTTTPFSQDASYSNLLPSLDFDLAITDSLKARFSYSETIARAGYGQLSAAQSPNGPGGSSLNGFTPTGTANNPALVPLQSDNLDLSLEYYFSESGYVSVGFFDKRVKNFIGNSVVNQNLFGIRNETGGPRAQAALAALKSGNFATDDSALFTMVAMTEHPEGTTYQGTFYAGGASNYNASNAQHVAFATAFDILPAADDPLYTFAVNQPVNNKEARIHGFEFGGQYFFGDTGLGILANYTVVRGDVGYDVTSDPNVNQFALTGLSDSANAVLMFEKFGISARLAYNWRDEFLQNINQGSWRNPIYVEAYDQIDLSVGYDINDHIAVSFEAINLTGEDIRWHGRSVNQLWRLEDQGARFALGARYKF